MDGHMTTAKKNGHKRLEWIYREKGKGKVGNDRI